MTAFEVKSLYYELLLNFGNQIIIPIVSILVTLFIATVSASWLLLKRLVSQPIERLSSKVENLGVDLVRVENAHNGRFVHFENSQKKLEESHFLLNSKVKSMEETVFKKIKYQSES